ELLRPHVDDCQRCQTTLSELRLLKSEIRKVSLGPEAGRFDAGRLAEVVRRRARWRRRRWVGLAAASAAAPIIPGIAVTIFRQRQALAEMIGDHVDITVKREEAFDVVGSDPQELARSFLGKIDFALQIPRLPEGQLVGARLCNIQGRGIPLASYEIHGRRGRHPGLSDPLRGTGEGLHRVSTLDPGSRLPSGLRLSGSGGEGNPRRGPRLAGPLISTARWSADRAASGDEAGSCGEGGTPPTPSGARQARSAGRVPLLQRTAE